MGTYYKSTKWTTRKESGYNWNSDKNLSVVKEIMPFLFNRFFFSQQVIILYLSHRFVKRISSCFFLFDLFQCQEHTHTNVSLHKSFRWLDTSFGFSYLFCCCIQWKKRKWEKPNHHSCELSCRKFVVSARETCLLIFVFSNIVLTEINACNRCRRFCVYIHAFTKNNYVFNDSIGLDYSRKIR